VLCCYAVIYLPLHNIDALPSVHELYKRPSYLLGTSSFQVAIQDLSDPELEKCSCSDEEIYKVTDNKSKLCTSFDIDKKQQSCVTTWE
jgi:hypothetical protein